MTERNAETTARIIKALELSAAADVPCTLTAKEAEMVAGYIKDLHEVLNFFGITKVEE